MRRRVQGGWLIMGMAVLGATFAGGREARAALTGITITGGINPINPDPIDQLILSAILQPFTDVHFGDHFTISGLPSDAKVLGTTQPLVPDPRFPFGFPPSVAWLPVLGHESVTWFFLGDSPILGTSSPQLLDPPSGDPFSITIRIPDDSPNIPTAGVTKLSYSYVLDGGTLNSAKQFEGQPPPSFILSDLSVVVPEPSSAAIVVLIVGTAGFSGLIARRRRARAA